MLLSALAIRLPAAALLVFSGRRIRSHPRSAFAARDEAEDAEETHSNDMRQQV